jgi:polyphosphate kinase 2 (PPK2 family)
VFEAAELGRKISKQEFKAEEPVLHTRLLKAQRALRETDMPVIIIVSGVEGAGKGEVVNRLNKWLDTRGIETSAFWEETDEERERPAYWRFWRRLPARGTIGIMFGSWYTNPIIDFVYDRIDNAEFERLLHRITEFEHMLTQDGALIVKFWFHLSREDQRKKLEKDKQEGRISPILKKFSKRYAEFEGASEHVLRMTDQGECSWHLVGAADRRYRDLTVGRILLEALEQRLEEGCNPRLRTLWKPREMEEDRQNTILDHVDLNRNITAKSYDRLLKKHQRRLYELIWHAKKRVCTRLYPSPPPVMRKRPTTTCGGSGGISRATATSPSTIVRGTGAYWWSGWKALPLKRNGSVPTRRSTTLKNSCTNTASYSASSGCT